MPCPRSGTLKIIPIESAFNKPTIKLSNSVRKYTFTIKAINSKRATLTRL